MAMSDVLYRLIGRRSPICPNESDILAFSENKLSRISYAKMERHFAECEDCRENLAFLGRDLDQTAGQPSERDVSSQTDRVLNYIRNDEINRSAGKHSTRDRVRFQISIPRLATVGLVLCAILAGGVFMITRPQPSAAREDYLLAVKYNRRVEMRVSERGGYSPYEPTRGGDVREDDLNFDRAILKLKYAEQEDAKPQDRLLLASIYLGRAKPADAKRALEILNQMAAQGIETPEALNDTGVAHFRLGHYDEASNYFSRALAKSPSYDEAIFNRALAESAAGRNDNARRDWQQFLEQSKDENWKKEGREHLKALNPTDGR